MTRALALLVPAAAAVALAVCPRPARGAEREPGRRPPATHRAMEPVFDGGLAPGWRDWGWCPRQLHAGEPAHLDLTRHGGWILAKPGLSGNFGGLSLRAWTAAVEGDFLEVRLDSAGRESFPKILVGPDHRVDLTTGWTEVWISMAELNPRGERFDRIVLRAARSVALGGVLVDSVALTEVESFAPAPGAWAAYPGRAQMRVDCRAPVRRISPDVYGIAFDARRDDLDTHQWELRPPARRWGGNPSSRYNWELGDAWNTGSDWFFRNVSYSRVPGFTWQTFLDESLARGIRSALTVPMLGWVAKDTRSYSFPVSVYGRQRSADPTRRDAGDGVNPDGKPLATDPTWTSVPSTPESVGRWVRAIRAHDKELGARTVHEYILDNEPALWNSTHRDVHPEPVGYDELLERTIAYGSAIRAADPDAVIAGPAEWGWPAYSFSARDAAAGFRLKPDRRAHGDVPLLAWYLDKLAEHERRSGVRVLDVVDVHFYPQGEGLRSGDAGRTDAETSARRIRSVRGLWDPTYVDESWIGEPIRLVPRLREWIDRYYPGRGISIGEYNFGAERHMSGALALAEALGRMGLAGVDSAFYWSYPAKGSAAHAAFRAFRDFDGRGGRFQDWSVPAEAPAGASLFASRDLAGTRLVLVALNVDPERALDAEIDLASCSPPVATRAFAVVQGRPGVVPTTAGSVASGVLHQSLPAYSITVLDLDLGKPAAGGRR